MQMSKLRLGAAGGFLYGIKVLGTGLSLPASHIIGDIEAGTKGPAAQ